MSHYQGQISPSLLLMTSGSTGRLLSRTVQTARRADSDDGIPRPLLSDENALTLARLEPDRRFITRRLEELKRK
jgi:hypothetical protein